MHKLAVTVYLLIFSGVNAVFVLCFCSTLVLVFPITIAITCTTCRPLATLHLLASCDSVADSLYACTIKRVHVLSNVPFCLKLIAVTWLVHCVASNAAAFSLVFEDLPVCVFPITKWLGLIPDNRSMSTMYWQIRFYPLELLTLLPLMIVTAFNVHTFFLGLAMLNVCADQTRYVGLGHIVRVKHVTAMIKA